MSDSKTTAHVVRDFKDAGTGESFKKGDTPKLNAGTYRNYKAAGLVSDTAPDTQPKPTDSGKAKAA